MFHLYHVVFITNSIFLSIITSLYQAASGSWTARAMMLTSRFFSLKIIMKDDMSNILGVKVMIAIMLQLNLDSGGIDMQITPPAYLVRKHF